jgi:hypothetical protein
MMYNEIPDITLKTLIDDGFIKPDTNVYAATNNSIIGRLNKDGAIILKVEGTEKTFPFPSGAARAIVKLSVNGWKFWRIKEDDKYIELSEIKKEYLLK